MKTIGIQTKVTDKRPADDTNLHQNRKCKWPLRG